MKRGRVRRAFVEASGYADWPGSPVPAQTPMATSQAQPPGAPESGRIYRVVTRYWSRIAVALVFLVGAAEWIIEGLTTGGALETYVFAWAAITGSLWFLFEKAEDALSEETREQVAGWLAHTDFRGRLESIPAQFAVLFDRIFGEKHWSRKCFYRSMLASVLAATLVYFVVGAGPTPDGGSNQMWAWDGGNGFIGLVLRSYERAESRRAFYRRMYSPEMIAAGFERCRVQAEDPVEVPWRDEPYPTLKDCEDSRAFAMRTAANIDPDTIRSPYQPGVVLQFTAWFMLLGLILNALPDYLSLLETRWLIGRMKRGRVMPFLVADVLATSAIQLAVIWLIMVGLGMNRAGFPWGVISGKYGMLSPFFFSAFFTSVWLWIYALTALVAQALLRVGRGAGFLLRITDVKERPFRSMGFTAVVLVSVGFLVGLPFVLWG